MYEGERRRPAGADAVGRRALDRRRRRLDRLRRRRRPAARRAAERRAPIPGPACYGRGGTRADGDRRRVRARDARRRRARGRRAARRASAARAALAPLAEALGVRASTTSRAGSSRSRPRTWPNAIREITVEQGQRPAARGARRVRRRRPAVRHAARARARDRREIVVPPYAGNFSAWGLLGADLDADGRADADPAPRRRARSPTATASSASSSPSSTSRAHDAGSDTASARSRFDMRYVGQEHTLTIGVPAADGSHRRLGRRRPRAVHRASTSGRSATRWTRRSRSSPCGRRCARRCRAAPRSARGSRRPTASRGATASRPTRSRAASWLDFALVDRADARARRPSSRARRSSSRRPRRRTSTPASRARVHESGSLFLTDEEAW